MTANYTPRPGYGLLSEEPCSACGKFDKWMRRGWCAACFQRWKNNGRPEGGPPRIYRPRGSATGPCFRCGAESAWITTHGWCTACQERWRRAGYPESGPPPKRAPAPVGECPICGRFGELRRRDDWCEVCHQRWRQSGWPGDKPAPALPVRLREKKPPLPDYSRTGARLDKLTRLRVMWTLARPGEENPYECIAPGCHETAHPGRQFRCAMHEQRFRRYGTYDPYQCARCGGDFKRCGGDRMLCDRCRESWGYCGGALHQGDRLLPLGRMSSGRPAGACKACSNRSNRERRHRQGMASRAEWMAGSARAVVADPAVSFVPGTLLSYKTLADALGLDEKEQRKRINSAVNAARRGLLQDHERALVTVWGEGYRITRAGLGVRAVLQGRALCVRLFGIRDVTGRYGA